VPPPPPGELLARPPLAALDQPDYWFILTCLSLVTFLALRLSSFFEPGLVVGLFHNNMADGHWRLLMLAATLLYVLPRRTLGIWLTRARHPAYPPTGRRLRPTP
jgi:hypothetical protein